METALILKLRPLISLAAIIESLSCENNTKQLCEAIFRSIVFR